jgi:hypothetical protein
MCPRKKQANSTAGHFFTLARVLGLLGLLAAAAVWYFKDCYDDRKRIVPELRDAYASLRVGEEQLIQSTAAANRQTRLFMDYLRGGNLDVHTMEQHLTYTGSTFQNADAACAKENEYFEKYLNVLRTTFSLFHIEGEHKDDDVVATRIDCSIWKKLLVEVHSISASKLVNEPDYRMSYVNRFDIVRDSSDRWEAWAREAFRTDYTTMEGAINWVEARRFDLLGSCLDCARRLVHRGLGPL